MERHFFHKPALKFVAVAFNWHLSSLLKSMGVFDAEDEYSDDGARSGRADKRNYNLDHLARMNFRRSARNTNFRDEKVPRD